MIRPLSIAHLAHKYGGVIISPDHHIESVSINSRTIEAGQTFLALKGEQFDGHEYLRGAFEKGAAALVTEQVFAGSSTQWVVKDSLRALGYMAHENRQQFSGKLIALTGSNGKTSVKEMLVIILCMSGEVHATQGNLNNHIGLPLTLLALGAEHDYAVAEMGASAVGEIHYLTHIAKPDVALVNNVGDAHVGGFGSLENIEIGKGEIFDGLSPDGTAVINLDSRGAERYLKSVQSKQQKVMTFSSVNAEADVFASNIQMSEIDSQFKLTADAGSSEVLIQLKVPGAHNIQNALAAAACCLAIGVPLERVQLGLTKFLGVAGRLQQHQHSSGAVLIDDSYNASPVSVKTAIDALSLSASKTILVLGAMAELGAESDQFHQEVGLYAKQSGIDQLVTVGALASHAAIAFGEGALSLETKQEAVAALLNELQPDVKILIKGSRSSRMEDVLNSIKIKGE